MTALISSLMAGLKQCTGHLAQVVLPSWKGHLVQEKRFYEALKNDREMNRRKYGNHPRRKGRAKYTISPNKPKYDLDVEVRPVFIYDEIGEEVRI